MLLILAVLVSSEPLWLTDLQTYGESERIQKQTIPLK